LIEMEIDQLDKYLENGDKVLDVGCANGYSTLQLASRKKICITGIDFIPKMIKQAGLRLHKMDRKIAGEANFKVGDITCLSEPAESYDKVIVVRVLINLREWRHQIKGLNECIKVLRPGGTLLLSEATLQGWRQLNKFRKEWKLPAIPMPVFNQYVDQRKLIKAALPHLKLVKVVDFASTYYVATRVIKPLLIKAAGLNIDVADTGMEWNRWFSQWPSWGDYGTQKLFVFEKLTHPK